ncbi:hypothetical protein AT15_04745 [Kosmotoga arenicorallina S304]|uniref:DUF4897 domain-containing protein n=1 Tax=Kosmotoga arenicorallina S304 TaxID=1453497 RepID=A0A176JWE3_9BACT|nr:DUF4897 domain-containing protein [Kosmotoga arenicorallina]OAA27998.1 hypothetical protein AT15_04745 [Kosmotoga arenicorallina S304]
MKFNTLLIIIVIVMVAITAVNMFMSFSNRLKIETLSYSSNYLYDSQGTVKMDSVMQVKFLKPQQIEGFLEQFEKSPSEKISEFQKSLEDFSKNLGRILAVEDFQSTATVISYDILEIREVAVVKGFAGVTDGQVNTSLGDVELDLSGDSVLTITLPSNAKVISVNPQPTSRPAENLLIWSNTGKIKFPEVVFVAGN